MGKNKKPKTIGRLIIDLTPLLDVIFIVLIVVLAGQDTFNMEANQKFAEAEVYVTKPIKSLMKWKLWLTHMLSRWQPMIP